MWKRDTHGKLSCEFVSWNFHFSSSQFSLKKHLLNNLSSKGVPIQVLYRRKSYISHAIYNTKHCFVS